MSAQHWPLSSDRNLLHSTICVRGIISQKMSIEDPEFPHSECAWKEDVAYIQKLEMDGEMGYCYRTDSSGH